MSDLWTVVEILTVGVIGGITINIIIYLYNRIKNRRTTL